MNLESPQTTRTAVEDPADIIIIRDPEIDVETLMQQVRANVAQRRAAGAYQEDLDAIADEVRAQVLRSPASVTAGTDQQKASPVLVELEERWLIREPEFRSSAPVIGPLIVAIRRAWNWMSTKWYIRGILEQQIGFNALVVQTLNEMYRANKTLAEEVKGLQAQCEGQREEIAALREQLAERGRGRAPQRDRPA